MSRRRRLLLGGLAVLLALAGFDLLRPPSRQLGTRAAIGAVRLYQRTLSPFMPALGVGCRFSPTCSRYAVGALERHGLVVGGARSVWRVARCGPWTPRGTVDPP